MKKIFSLTVLFFFSEWCQAQLSMESWHKGMVVTADNDTLQGNIKYDLENNIIQIDSRGQIKALSAYKVFYVEFYDEILKNFRRFYTLAYNMRSDYQTPVIFELMYEGSLSLLAREKIVAETTSMGPSFYGPSNRIVQMRVKHDFYFLDKKGTLSYYSGKKNELFTILDKKRSEIKNYIKQNRLKVDNLRDLIRITSFYNSI
jgi:hypothetical protein